MIQFLTRVKIIIVHIILVLYIYMILFYFIICNRIANIIYSYYLFIFMDYYRKHQKGTNNMIFM